MEMSGRTTPASWARPSSAAPASRIGSLHRDSSEPVPLEADMSAPESPWYSLA